MPAQVHIYISQVVNSYIGVQGGYDMPTFIVLVNAAWGTIINFKGESAAGRHPQPYQYQLPHSEAQESQCGHRITAGLYIT